MNNIVYGNIEWDDKEYRSVRFVLHHKPLSTEERKNIRIFSVLGIDKYAKQNNNNNNQKTKIMSNNLVMPDENDHPQAGEPNFIDTNAEAKANLAPIQAPPQEPLPEVAAKATVPTPPQAQPVENKDADKKVSTAKTDTKKPEPKGKKK